MVDATSYFPWPTGVVPRPGRLSALPVHRGSCLYSFSFSCVSSWTLLQRPKTLVLPSCRRWWALVAGWTMAIGAFCCSSFSLAEWFGL